MQQQQISKLLMGIPGQEPSDIHQRMYEIATQNSATTLQAVLLVVLRTSGCLALV